VGSGSVGLTAIPEPASLAMAGLGLVAVLGLGRRRRSERGFFFGGFNVMQRVFTWGAACAVALCASASLAQTVGLPSGALLETFRDDFGDDMNPHADACDYNNATGPGNCFSYDPDATTGRNIWVDSYQGFIVEGANLFSRDSNDTSLPPENAAYNKAGKLFMADRVNPQTWGWEGDQTDSPLLYTTLGPANGYNGANDFDVITKVDAATAGNWSTSGIVARVRYDVEVEPGVFVNHNPSNVGNGGDTPATENYVLTGPFQTQDRLQTKNHVNGGQAVDAGGPTFAVAGATWVRLVKTGPLLTAYSSKNGTTWTQATTVINQALNTPANSIDIGLTHGNYSNTLLSSGTFDFFELNVYEEGPAAAYFAPASGNWNLAASWATSGGVTVPPNSNTIDAIFPAAGGAGTSWVTNNVTVKSLTLSNTNERAIVGPGTITLAASAGSSAITVNAGTHQISTPVTLGSDTTISTALANSGLHLKNALNLNGRTLTISGLGQVFINNNIDTTNGTVNSTGRLGGQGRINGALNNNAGGTVSPGLSPGKLTVEGNYTQAVGANLNVEVGGAGAGEFDILQTVAGGTASLNGNLNVELFDGYGGDDVSNAELEISSYEILDSDGARSGTFANAATSVSVTDEDDNVVGSFTVTYGSNGVTLSAFAGQPGDYNFDGSVTAADYTRWRNKLAAGDTYLINDNTPGTVTLADYTFWKSQYGNFLAGAGAAVGASAVPEPGSLVLLLIGAVAACGLIRRR
jgi:hypothetical protein